MSGPSSSWRRDVLRRPRKGDIAPRTVEKLKSWKISYLRLDGVVERANPRSGLSATHRRKRHSALFKVSLHDCVGGFDLFTYGGAYSYHNVRVSGDTGAS